MDAYMVLAHCPATGKSYAVDPVWGKYETVVSGMLERLLFSLRLRQIDPADFVFDVLIRPPGSVVYLPHRELSYDEANGVASHSLAGKRP